MNTASLISDAMARFSHNSAKAYLKDKYHSKLIVAEQGGLWTVTPELLGFLASSTDEAVILIDNFENPVKVNRVSLYDVLCAAYNSTMEQWHAEWESLESKR